MKSILYQSFFIWVLMKDCMCVQSTGLDMVRINYAIINQLDKSVNIRIRFVDNRITVDLLRNDSKRAHGIAIKERHICSEDQNTRDYRLNLDKIPNITRARQI